jgi:hypothetical protein
MLLHFGITLLITCCRCFVRWLSGSCRDDGNRSTSTRALLAVGLRVAEVGASVSWGRGKVVRPETACMLCPLMAVGSYTVLTGSVVLEVFTLSILAVKPATVLT